MSLTKAQQFLTLLAVLFVVGCASLGIPQPATFNQRLAVGYATVTTVRQSAITLLTANKISADDAQNVQQQANNARAGLDIARTMARTDQTAAESKLASVRAALTALQAYLASKDKP